MQVEQLHESELTDEQRQAILDLQHAAFPHTKVFATQRWYHTPIDPGESWMLASEAGQLCASVRVVWRTVRSASGEFRVGGIGNVCSDPARRGSGAATACMEAAGRAIGSEADFGILFCGPALVKYYARFGWRDAENPVLYTDADTGEQKLADRGDGHMMILGGKQAAEDWPAGQIDLNGRDW